MILVILIMGRSRNKDTKTLLGSEAARAARPLLAGRGGIGVSRDPLHQRAPG